MLRRSKRLFSGISVFVLFIIFTVLSWSFVNTALGEPSTPTNVQATKGYWTDRVKITWNASSGALIYYVYVTTFTTQTTSIGATANTFYDDFEALRCKTYWYQVRAFHPLTGFSGYSLPSFGWVDGGGAGAPAPPTGVTASDGTDINKVRISWDPNPGLEIPSPAESYSVYRATSPEGAKIKLGELSWDDTYYDDTSALPCVQYYYFVCAKNPCMLSSYSTYDAGYRAGTPSPPTGVSASDGTYTDKVRVTWSSVLGATSYTVYRATSNGGIKSNLGSTSGTMFDDTSALISTIYYYWVKAKNSYGTSDFSFNDTGFRACTYSIYPTTQHFSSSGGTGSVSVTAESGCDWTATSNDSWIKITSGSSGSGNGTVSYSVLLNSSTSLKTGTITIAKNTFTVKQRPFLPENQGLSSANDWSKTQITKIIPPKDPTVPTIAVDGNNGVHVAWTSGESQDGSVYYANSINSWQQVEIAKTADRYQSPSIFVDKNNAVYIAWVDRRNGPNGDGSGWDIYYATSADGWINHLVTDGPSLACYEPSIIVDTNEDIHIAYRRFTDPKIYNDQVFYTNKNSNWTEQRVSFTGYSRIYDSDMDIDNNGIVHVVFSNWGDTSHIWYASSLNNWINVQVDNAATSNWWDDRTNPSIEVDSNNVAHVVWEDRRNTALEGDPAFNGGLPNRTEIYYASSDTGWTNIEIGLPIDTNGPRVKRSPSIVVQKNKIHLSWIQQETDAYVSQSNLLYGNSDNWNSAINISRIPDSPIVDPFEEGEVPSIWVSCSSNALAVDNNGKIHVTWWEYNNSNRTNRLLYATDTDEFPWLLFYPALIRKK